MSDEINQLVNKNNELSEANNTLKNSARNFEEDEDVDIDTLRQERDAINRELENRNTDNNQNTNEQNKWGRKWE